MKKMYFFIVLFLTLTTTVRSQCTGNNAYPGTPVAVPTNNQQAIIGFVVYPLEYALVTNAIAGQVLNIDTSYPTDYITVRSGTPTGPVLYYGPKGVPFTNTFTGNIYVILSSNSTCGSSGADRILALYNVTGTHLNFDGSDDRVKATNANLPLGNTSKTLEAWVKTSQNINAYSAIASFGDLSTSNRFAFNIFGGKLYFIGQNNDYFTNITISDNVWHHIAATHDGTTLKVYIDGLEVGTVAKTLNTTGTQINIGHRSDNTEQFQGNIDEVRIWNVARTAAQIAGSRSCELAGNETGLVAYYNFNLGVDASANPTVITLPSLPAGSNGTLTGFALTGATSNWLAGSNVTSGSIIPSVATVITPVVYNQGATATALTATIGTNGTSLAWYTSATGFTTPTSLTPSTTTAGSTSYWVASKNANGCESARTEIVITVKGSATHLNFDGVDDYVSCGNILTASYTKEAWIYLTDANLANNIISGGNDGNHAFWASAVYGNRLSAGHNGIYNSVQDPTPLAINTWYHVAVTYDAATTTMKLYKNGTQVGTTNTGVPNYSSGNAVRLGAFVDGSNLLKGNMDEARIWNRALSQTDIASKINCELLTPASQPGLVAYYKFNQGFDAATNTTIANLADASANTNNGTLNGFAKTGTTSNFLGSSPAVTTGNTCTTLSTNDFAISNNFKLYPNPTNGLINIEFNQLTNPKLEVCDIHGRILLNQKLNNTASQIDVTNYPLGVYLFKITSDEGTTTSKVVKQ